MAEIKDSLPKELYDILVCPICKTDVKYSTKKDFLVCSKCKRKYPIKDGIPVMLVDKAE